MPQRNHKYKPTTATMRCNRIGYEGNQHSNPNKSAAPLDDEEEDEPMDFAVPMDDDNDDQ
jgi:hypothetical protein